MRMSHKARFNKYRDDTVIVKSTQYAKWTLPQLMADLQIIANSASSQALVRDYQELGPLLVNNLAAKLARLLFPSNYPFFTVDPSQALVKAAESKGLTLPDLNAGLARLERDACKRVFINASYNQLVMALKHLIVTGNVLLHRDQKRKRSTSYGLQSFSVLRDGQGEVLDIVLREYTQYASLPASIRSVLKAANTLYSDEQSRSVELYTRIERVRGTDEKGAETDVFKWKVTQEIDSTPVGEDSTYPYLLCPWHVCTWSLIAGEHYGRGLVEDYAGGFAKLSDKSQALTLYEINSMKVVNLVAPGMGADVDELATAECGEYVQGQNGAVTAFESGDANKVQAAQLDLQSTFTNLSRAFMFTANNRDAERVTMYELQQAAQEAEVTLGGVHSSLAESMQIPLAHLLITEVNPSTLEGIITGDMTLDIVAGLPALGRASDVQGLVTAAQEAAAVIPVFNQVSRRIDAEKVLDIIFTGQSFDTSLIYKGEDQLKEEQAALEQQAQGAAQVQDTAVLDQQTQALQGMQQTEIM